MYSYPGLGGGTAGNDGRSAYQVWLDEGNVGTEADFLASLKGDQGDPGIPGTPGAAGADGGDGASAYEVWVANGGVGSQSDFLLSLKGAKGDKGDPGDPGANGSNGLSAYQIWQNAGNVGTEAEFLASLVGADGTPGTDGVDGQNGQNGLSAYQIWQNAGNVGTIEDFLASLVGATGAAGANGTNGQSAYQIWTAQGNVGTEAQFLASLNGADGQDGAPGVDGADGLSAYQIWQNAGNVGTTQQFLNSLIGADGVPGGARRSAHRLVRLFYIDTDTIQIIPRGDVDLTFWDGDDRHRFTFAEGTSRTVNLTDVQITGAAGVVGDRTYHFFLGRNPSSGVVTGHFLPHGSFSSSSLFDSSKLQPIAGQIDAAFAGYSWLYCGSLVLNSSAQFRGFAQVGDRIIYESQVLSLDTSSLSTSAANLVSVPTPLGLTTFIHGMIFGGASAGQFASNGRLIYRNDTTGTTTNYVELETNSNSQVSMYALTSGKIARLYVDGYVYGF